jgi:hypothetical protein
MTTDYYDAETHDLLLRTIPAPDETPYKDWDTVLELAARDQVESQHGRRFPTIRLLARRRLLVAAFASAALVVTAGIAVAAGAFDIFQSPEQQIVPGSAANVLSYQTSFGREVTGWAAPTPDGRQCAFFQFDDPSVAPTPSFHPDSDSLGEACPTPGDTGGGGGLVEWWPRGDGSYSILLLGLASPSSGIVRFGLEGPNGPLTTIASTKSLYVAELPAASAHGVMPAGGPYYLVGYDAAGNVLTRQDINRTTADGTTPTNTSGH